MTPGAGRACTCQSRLYCGFFVREGIDVDVPRTRCELIACGILLVALAGCGAEEPPPELPPRAIQWQRVSSSLAGQQRMISGIVTAVDETELAFEVGGSVLTVEVDLGDVVEQGQVLARLDPEPL